MKDIPGNSVASAAQYQRELLRGAEAMMRVEGHLSDWWAEGVEFKGLSLRAPKGAGGEWLAVLRADKDGAAVVAFVSGETYLDTVRRVAVSIENKSLKWKDDDYAK